MKRIYLHKILKALLLLLLPSLMSGCEDTDNGGYPYAIGFPKEGGRITLGGAYYKPYIIIGDKEGSETVNFRYTHYTKDSLSVVPDTVILSYKWLTVTNIISDGKLYVTAEPSNESKPRQMEIRFDGWITEYYKVRVLQQ